jgi:hypothetical protein
MVRSVLVASGGRGPATRQNVISPETTRSHQTRGLLQSGHTGYTSSSAPHVEPETGRQHGRFVASMEKRWSSDRPRRADAVRYTSVDPATQRSIARQDDTWRDTQETTHPAENSQLAGRFRWWWQVQGSNLRRLSRRFIDRRLSPARSPRAEISSSGSS